MHICVSVGCMLDVGIFPTRRYACIVPRRNFISIRQISWVPYRRSSALALFNLAYAYVCVCTYVCVRNSRCELPTPTVLSRRGRTICILTRLSQVQPSCSTSLRELYSQKWCTHNCRRYAKLSNRTSKKTINQSLPFLLASSKNK